MNASDKIDLVIRQLKLEFPVRCSFIYETYEYYFEIVYKDTLYTIVIPMYKVQYNTSQQIIRMIRLELFEKARKIK